MDGAGVAEHVYLLFHGRDGPWDGDVFSPRVIIFRSGDAISFPSSSSPGLVFAVPLINCSMNHAAVSHDQSSTLNRHPYKHIGIPVYVIDGCRADDDVRGWNASDRRTNSSDSRASASAPRVGRAKDCSSHVIERKWTGVRCN